MTAILWKYDDGGRAAAGYKGRTGDCVTRAIAIATGMPYQQVYDDLSGGMRVRADRRKARGKTERSRSARTGVAREVYEPYLFDLGWIWMPTMGIGTGCTVHLAFGELPLGRVIARLSRHMCAVLDGTVHDTFDPSRDGTRCVYGFFMPGLNWEAP